MQIIQGLNGYNTQDIVKIVLDFFDELRNNNIFEGLDFRVKNISVFGSRIKGTALMNSDLDVKIEYFGSAREDDLFNVLNDRNYRLEIEGIVVDFFPEKIFHIK